MPPDPLSPPARTRPHRRAGGLGKGLSDILRDGPRTAADPGPLLTLRVPPGTARRRPGSHEDPAGDDARNPLSQGLETVRATLDVDVCAYLHQPPGEGLRLFVVTRPGGSEHPDPFLLLELMRTWGRTASAPAGTAGALAWTMIRSAHGSGVHLLGRFDRWLGPAEVELARVLCRLVSLAVPVREGDPAPMLG